MRTTRTTASQTSRRAVLSENSRAVTVSVARLVIEASSWLGLPVRPRPTSSATGPRTSPDDCL